jgi:hypothetical protein
VLAPIKFQRVRRRQEIGGAAGKSRHADAAFLGRKRPFSDSGKKFEPLFQKVFGRLELG